MSLTTLPTDLAGLVFGFLNLRDMSSCASSCKPFNRIINSSIFLKRYLCPADLKVANKNFLLRHFSSVSFRCLLEFRIQLVSRDELKALPETEDTRENLKVAKLMLSLFFKEDSRKKWGQTYDPTGWIEREKSIQIHYQQLPYRYLMELIEKIPFDILPKFSQLPAEQKRQWLDGMKESDCIESVQGSSQGIKRSNAGTDILGYFFYDYIHLLGFHRQTLIEVFAFFWSKHQVVHLSPQNEDPELMLTEVFLGMCKAISNQNHDLGEFDSREINEEQLKAFNQVLRGRKIECLALFPIKDITPETMREFFEIIEQQNNEHSFIFVQFDEEKASREKRDFTPTEAVCKEFKKKFKITHPKWRIAPRIRDTD